MQWPSGRWRSSFAIQNSARCAPPSTRRGAWAAGTRAAPQGLVRSSWALKGGRFEHNVTLPGSGPYSSMQAARTSAISPWRRARLPAAYHLATDLRSRFSFSYFNKTASSLTASGVGRLRRKTQNGSQIHPCTSGFSGTCHLSSGGVPCVRACPRRPRLASPGWFLREALGTPLSTSLWTLGANSPAQLGFTEGLWTVESSTACARPLHVPLLAVTHVERPPDRATRRPRAPLLARLSRPRTAQEKAPTALVRTLSVTHALPEPMAPAEWAFHPFLG